MLPVTSMLVVAAHPDDEVLGCGGYIAARVRSGDEVAVMFVSDGVTSREGNLGASEIAIRRQAAMSAAKVLGVKDVLFGDFPDNKLDSVPILEIIKFIEGIVSRTKPSVVLTHFGGDLNVDHRIVNQAVITACRPTSDQCVKQILFFEVPSSTEWQIPSKDEAFIPNWFEDISESLDVKIKALEQYAFELRDWPHPRSVEGVKHLAHWRGASCGVNAAEAFILGRRTP
jgi:LmbE family N-acetylglucosaminyl deacetylase